MEIKLEIPDYDETGFKFHWEDGFEIEVKESQGAIIISANKVGLISLAVQLLTLAQDTVPTPDHFHLDEYNGLEEGSKELIIAKV